MPAGLRTRSEIVKLGRLLGTASAELVFLEDVEAEELALLREQVANRLFEADRDALLRVAAASRLLPGALAAAIGQRYFGALLCARIAGLLDVSRAVELAGRLPADFLADVAVELDPRRASAVIAGIPATQIRDVAIELLARKEYVVMGRFIGYLADETIAQVLEQLGDEELLRVAFVLEDKRALDGVVRLLSDRQRHAIIRTAAEFDLWPETLELLSHLGPASRRELIQLTGALDAAVLDRLVAVAQDQGLWDALLPLVREMDSDARRRFVALPSVRRVAVLDALVAASAEHGLWPELLPLVALLPAAARRRVAASASRLERPLLERIVCNGWEPDLWPALVDLAVEMDEDGQRVVGELIARGPDRVVRGTIASVTAGQRWPEMLAIARYLPARELGRLAQRVRVSDLDAVAPQVVAAAVQTGEWEAALGLFSGLKAPQRRRLARVAGELDADLRALLLEQARALGVFEQLGEVGAVLEAG
ncbi:MAG: hypothetical protein ACR2HD_06660 [Solirubrobacteraceae bacterium]